jgi:enediyne polyketide synthase
VSEAPAIAIVGLACHYPGASSPAQLWGNVIAGRREFRPLPRERLPASDYASPDPRVEDQTYLRELAVLTKWHFDPAELGIPPVSAAVSDVSHWLALTTAIAAIDDAEIVLDSWDRSRVGVVLGNTLGGEVGRAFGLRLRWPYVRRAIERAFAERGHPPDEDLLEQIRHHYTAPFPPANEDSLAGTMSNTITGRISNYFDLGGGAFTVDGACASSLLAVARGCEALERGEWDLALCGGVDVSLDPYELVGFAKAGALAVEDIRPYDARAEGMLPGEGCGILVLARLDDARRRGLSCRATIRGWGISSDGRGAITAPRVIGQQRALTRAWARAGCDPASATLIEGHGTGTRLGDQVEIEGLLRLLGDAPPRRRWLGSIKGNIGHCKAAAGAAGLIKATLALEHAVIPPTRGCEEPNPVFHRGRGRLLPALEASSWEATSTPRRAGVSAFGFGGVNAHLVLEEIAAGPGRRRGRVRPPKVEPTLAPEPAILALARADEAGLIEGLRGLRPFLARASRAELHDLAHHLARDVDTGEGAGPVRAAIVAETPRRALELLDETLDDLDENFAAGDRPAAGVHLARVPERAEDRGAIVALFPGQGSQRPGMGRRLRQRCPDAASRLLDGPPERSDPELPGLVERVFGWDPRLHSPSEHALAELEIEDTALAQPGVVAASLLGLEVLRGHGLAPTIVLGHSLGEISALAAAGALSAADALALARRRGLAMAGLDLDDPGAMLALTADADDHDEIEELLRRAPGQAVIASYNSRAQLVLAGEREAIRWLESQLSARGFDGRLLPVSHAFHSPLMAPARPELERAARELAWAALDDAPKLASSTLGDWLEPGVDIPTLLGEQLTAPVRFVEALETVGELAGSSAMWIEVGPGSAAIELARATLGEDLAVFELDPRTVSAARSLPAALARAWTLGHDVELARWTRTAAVREVDPERPPRPAIVNPCELDYETEAEPEVEPERSAGGEHEDELEDPLTFALDWLAQRAGFPRDTLRPEHRIREDLNLDSIKAVELSTALSARCGRSLPSLQQWEQLTIHELVARIVDAPLDDGEGAGALPEGVEDFGAEYCASLTLDFVAAPLRWAPAPLPGPPSVIVTGAPEDALVDALVLALSDRGFAPVWVDRELLDDASAITGSLIWLLGDEENDRGASGRGEAETERAREWLELARWCAARAETPGAPPLRLLVLRRSAEPLALDERDAGAALLSSLALERGSLSVRWLRLPSELPPGHLAAVLRAELQVGGEHPICAWDHRGVRHVAATRERRASPAKLAIEPGELVVVSGGAKGITRELARILAQTTGATLALLGRSPASSEAVRAGLEYLAAAGVEAHYHRCDVCDAAEVRATITAIVAERGPIKGLVHGAGLSQPMAIDEIDEAAWSACVDTKVRGLLNLWQALEGQELALLHLVTSVLGHTGMARQLDYAFANAWLAGFAARIQHAHPQLHVVSLGYSVWAEIGLGVALGAVEALRPMGVRALSTEAAVAAYARELQSRERSPLRVITGRLVPALERRLHPRLPPRRSRFLEQVTAHVPGVELVAVSTLDHGRDVHLHDHVFEGTPMLAGVFGLEAMAAAAAACVRRSDLVEVRDWELQRAIPVPADAPTRIRVHARVLDDEVGHESETVRVRVGLRAEVDGFRDECFHACLVFGGRPEAEPEPLAELPAARELGERELAALFQGPLYRWLTGVRVLEHDRLGAFDARVPGPLRYVRDAPRDTLTPYPALRDALLQTILIVLAEPGLPVRIGRVRLFRRPAAGAELRVRTRARRHGQRWVVDVDAFTEDGRAVESLVGVEVTPVGGA